jgi:hypothetical protein
MDRENNPRARTIRARSSRGSVIIEFILVCPILLAFIGYTLRLTQLLQAHQIAMAISREAATEAFRQCTDISVQTDNCPSTSSTQICLDVDSTQSGIGRCLTRLKSKYASQWAILRPPGALDETFSIDLEVYRYDMDRIMMATDCNSSPASNRKYRISSNSQISELFMDAAGLTSLCQRNRVARARLIFKFAPTAAFLNLNSTLINQTYDIIDDTVV